MKYFKILESKEKGLSESLLIILGLVILGNIVGSVIAILILKLFTDLSFTQLLGLSSSASSYKNGWWILICLLSITTFFSFFGAGLFYWKIIEKKSLSAFDFNPKINISQIFIMLLAQLSFMPLLSWAQEINAKMKLPASLKTLENLMKSMEESGKNITDYLTEINTIPQLMVVLLFVALLAGLGEEFIFRGLIQRKIFKSSKNPHLAIWITAILFSAIHFQFYGFLPRMMLGALLGYFYFWSGNLWVPIIAHTFNNGLAVIISYLIYNKKVSPELDKMENLPLISILLSTVIFTGIMFSMYQNYRKLNTITES